MPLSWLIGTWVGVGLGQYPTIEDFRFGQELRFWTDGGPFLHYTSYTWILDEQGNRIKPGGSESGFWRPQPDNKLELLLAINSGYTELLLGQNIVTQIDGASITSARCELKTDVIVATESAKPYEASERLYGLIGDDLGWTYDMAAVGQEMQNHLSAKLARVSYLGDPLASRSSTDFTASESPDSPPSS